MVAKEDDRAAGVAPSDVTTALIKNGRPVVSPGLVISASSKRSETSSSSSSSTAVALSPTGLARVKQSPKGTQPQSNNNNNNNSSTTNNNGSNKNDRVSGELSGHTRIPRMH